MPKAKKRDGAKSLLDHLKAKNLQAIQMGLLPDWNEFWTPAQAEKQMNGFKFNGPGWYYIRVNRNNGAPVKVDTILVLPHEKEGHFRFYIYHHRDNLGDAINWLLNCGCKVDERE